MAADESSESLKQAFRLIPRTRGCDRGRLRRNLERLSKENTAPGDKAAAVLAQISRSVEERKRRMEKRPQPVFPPELPIVGRRKEIVQAIRENQVVVLSGETGSGKTTQIPKMCIEAGRGVDGLIGCTQPRRIAALTVAARIAEELGDESLVGHKIRFQENSNERNFIRILTDGMLLAEAQAHPSLNNYDTIIIDEAHERSLNIDVLLGMLRRLIGRRRNLKLIITSATLDTAKFSAHFADAPIIEVSGRTYPVEIRYEEAGEEEAGLSLAEQTALNISRLVRESPRGDILAFLPTEQDIRDTIDLTTRNFGDRLSILPLYARLPASEQKKAFVSGGKRKLVVATNVAETSLTIPGIRYVVDSGLARISRYNPGTGTHGLPVDPISRASADQRAGRCGRVENGICIRMYSEEDYSSRAEYTPPEIRRTNLAEVILRLLDLGIRDIESFPFVDPPDPAGIRDGLRTLKEIGALSTVSGKGRGARVKKGVKGREEHPERRLSSDGRIMARLPLDPRLARVLLQADREGCLGDVLPIAAALSLPDPRERPPEKAGSADAAHKKFLDADSDFLGWLNIWDAFRTYRKKGSYSGKLKKFCSENYLSFRRMREWMDVHRQLTLVMEENGYRPHRLDAGPSLDKKGHFTARYAAIHRSVLSGFLSHIARHEEKGNYEATRNRKVRIHPGSVLARSGVSWIMAAEIVRTSRLYARSTASIDPDWLADLGGDLAARTWKNPHWSRKAGAVMATEQMRLYGFLVSDDVTVPYGTVKPAEAREIFIKSALVEGDIPDLSPYGFLKDNMKLYRRLSAMEDKLRRRDLLAGEEALTAFYAERLPADVLDLGTLNRHIRDQGQNHLQMTESDLLVSDPDSRDLNAFPDRVEVGGEKWKLSYTFDPDSEKDGVTLQVPSGRLTELKAGEADWIVPGLLREKAEALMRGLPKSHRRKLIPIPATADEAMKSIRSDDGDLIRALSAWLYRERGVHIPLEDWDAESIPEHLKVRFSLLDESGREKASGRNPSTLQSVQSGTRESGRTAFYRKQNERHGLKSWPEAHIEEQVTIAGGAVLWPGLKDSGKTVSLVFFENRHEAERHHREGQIRLARLHWAREIRDMKRSMLLSGETRINSAFLGGAAKLESAVWDRVVSDLFGQETIRSQENWNTFLADGGRKMGETAAAYFSAVSNVISKYAEVRKALDDLKSRSHRKAFISERQSEAEALVAEDFVTKREPQQWDSIPRWLDAVLSRARKGDSDPSRDRKALEAWEPLKKRLGDMVENLSPLASREKAEALKDAEVMLQELKVALFATGEVRPAGRISESRMAKRLDEINLML